ncbi:MAG: T9SS type A sorting domain-containing protein [Kaistella sp.]|nr:T9SS type A sorting domain-containing protein [Kaistella sp.]
MKTKLLSAFFILCISSPLFSQYNWQQMNTIYPAGINNISINFSIVNEQVIWANYWNAGGKVAFTKSTDAGNTWNAISNVLQYNDQDFTVEDFQAVSENAAFLGASYILNSGKGRLYKTLNGGLTWTPIKEFATRLTYVHFWDVSTGIVVCYPDMNPTAPKKIEIFRTTDGGTTWVAKGGILLADSDPSQIPRYIHDDLNDSFWFGSSGGEMIKTKDKGATWTVIQTPYDSSHYQFGPKSLGDFVITGSNTAFFTDYNTGKLYKTTDGFITEQYVSDPGFGRQTHLEKIPNTNILIAVSGLFETGSVRGSKYSTDDGLTWNVIGNTGMVFVKSGGINMTFAHGGDGTGGYDDYWKIVKLVAGTPPNPNPNPTPTPAPNPNTGVGNPPTTTDDYVFGIYPVPTGDYLYFNSEIEDVGYTIWDSAGRLILKGNTGSKQVDVSYFEEGVYHIKILYMGTEIIRKFIKK